MPRRRRSLRLEKPKGLADRIPTPRQSATPEVSGNVTLNINGREIEVPILSSQDEIMADVEKFQKFLRDKFKKLLGK